MLKKLKRLQKILSLSKFKKQKHSMKKPLLKLKRIKNKPQVRKKKLRLLN